MTNPKAKTSRIIALLFCVLTPCTAWHSAQAQDKEVADAKNAPTPAPKAPAGLLPIPDYTAGFWDNSYLTEDWLGERTTLAEHGIQFGAQLNQFVQGVSGGGANQATEYGGNANYTIDLDLMKMGVLPGALIQFRAESRYGDSVNGDAGSILPVNTQALFPLTPKLNQNVGITVTDLNYTQFLSPHLGVVVGKIDTLSGDPNEFASGRGTSQFMNANFVFNPVLSLRLPYSTLAAGLIWMPIPTSQDRGITVTSMFMNTDDSSTTSGFDDFNKGTTWNGEADFKYKFGDLPGGMNVGGLYSFDQHFTQLNSRLVFQPGQGLSLASTSSTWAVYWSGWQYLLINEKLGDLPLAYLDGSPNHRGIGLFSRVGVADQETNPIQCSASGGIGGRGMIPSRDNDTFGIGYYYTSLQDLRLAGPLGLRDSTQGFEAFYNIGVTPACRVTLDVQVVEPVQSSEKTATILGVRASLNF